MGEIKIIMFKIFRKLLVIFGHSYKSETSKYRNNLQKFCKGCGLDIGFGGDPISPAAITLDLSRGRMAYCGDSPMNLDGDASNLFWFSDNVLDYVYSSHCLEDFENTKDMIIEWTRVLKIGGNLVLLLPDQKRYENHCKMIGAKPNPAHKIKNFGLLYLKNILSDINYLKVLYERDFKNNYNFLIVIKKIN
jgi:predicted SAM-dependent methyltransferase